MIDNLPIKMDYPAINEKYKTVKLSLNKQIIILLSWQKLEAVLAASELSLFHPQ